MALSPLNQRRWRNFKANRRAFWSLWLFLVLYGHVFRNAMLIVIAGFPALFVSVFFGGSLIIETIFSLDGLGQLGFRAAVERDYPVIFGTLFFFGLIGLVMGIISDLMYVWIDPRIDFGTRRT